MGGSAVNNLRVKSPRIKPFREKRPSGMPRIAWRGLLPMFKSLYYEKEAARVKDQAAGSVAQKA